MLDSFNRNITYLRVSVTDRCNLRCFYCMPHDGVQWVAHDQIITFEEIVEVVRKAIVYGITKVRITGGEPLVRKGIVDLVQKLFDLGGIQTLAMTTNGLLLPDFAEPLKKAGLKKLNISLDTLDAERYSYITRSGDVNEVLKGIDIALDAGFEIKLNCVVWKDTAGQNMDQLKQYAEDKKVPLRLIHQMNLSTGEFSVVEGGDAGNCTRCNRLRLTSTGIIKSCLFSEGGYNIRELGIEKAILQAIENKPRIGTFNKSETFNRIGG